VKCRNEPSPFCSSARLGFAVRFPYVLVAANNLLSPHHMKGKTMATEFEDLFPEDIKTNNNAVAVRSSGTVAIRNKYSSQLMEDYAAEKWLKNSEVAEMFGVDPKTVTKWFKNGKLRNIRMFRTPGGHRRYSTEDIKKILEDNES
jgi:hypothetical protein